MTEATVNNDKITICGFEVDKTVRSHDINPDVLKLVRAIIKKSKTKVAAAKALGIPRQLIDRVYSGSCAPDTYETILNTLFPDQKTAA